MNPVIQRICAKALFAAIAAVFVAGHLCAQQTSPGALSQSAGSSTNLLEPVAKSWKDNMLERQFRNSGFKTFDFGEGSLSGVAVNPNRTERDSESPSARRKRERLEEMKFMMLMNADDPSKDPALEDLIGAQNFEERAVSGSPLERLYLKQMQKERNAATNRARAEIEARDDSNPFYVPGAENRAAGANQDTSVMKNPSSPTRPTGTTATPMFQSLFNPPASSPNQLRLQQTHAEQFRQSFNPSPAHSFGSGLDAARSPSLVRTPSSFSPPAASVSVQPAVSPPTAAPQSQSPGRAPLDYSPPRRKF